MPELKGTSTVFFSAEERRRNIIVAAINGVSFFGLPDFLKAFPLEHQRQSSASAAGPIPLGLNASGQLVGLRAATAALSRTDILQLPTNMSAVVVEKCEQPENRDLWLKYIRLLSSAASVMAPDDLIASHQEWFLGHDIQFAIAAAERETSAARGAAKGVRSVQSESARAPPTSVIVQPPRAAMSAARALPAPPSSRFKRPARNNVGFCFAFNTRSDEDRNLPACTFPTCTRPHQCAWPECRLEGHTWRQCELMRDVHKGETWSAPARERGPGFVPRGGSRGGMRGGLRGGAHQ